MKNRAWPLRGSFGRSAGFTPRIYSEGQALVVLLIFMVVSITITSAAIVMLLVNSGSTTRIEQGVSAQSIAESGVENALLKLLRDPSYSGETLTVNGGSATVVVTGESSKTITSLGRVGNFVSTVQVNLNYTNEVFEVTSWKKIY